MSESTNILIDDKYQVQFLEKTSDNTDVIEVKLEMLVETATYLKMNKDTQFNVLFSVSGVEKPESLEVVYHLFSTVFNKKLVLKVILNKNTPELPSIRQVYSAADWHEREAYDLFGIIFKDHPNLERILLPKDWKGHPLRKNYVNDDERLGWNER